MLDLIYLLVTLGFAAATAGLIYVCTPAEEKR